MPAARINRVGFIFKGYGLWVIDVDSFKVMDRVKGGCRGE
jgi:hypothetical protein